MLVGFGPTILFVVLLFWLFRRAGNVQNALGAFGRSRARRYEASGDKVTFADVAGIEEAKNELSEVVDFLQQTAAAPFGHVRGAIAKDMSLLRVVSA